MLRVLRYTDKQFSIVGWICVCLELEFFMFCSMFRELFCVFGYLCRSPLNIYGSTITFSLCLCHDNNIVTEQYEWEEVGRARALWI